MPSVGSAISIAERAPLSGNTSRWEISVVRRLEAGDIDSAIDSLRRSVEGLRRMNAPYGQEHRLGWLAIALALRGADDDILPSRRRIRV